MSAPQRLALVDTETGERHPFRDEEAATLHAEIARQRDVIKGLQRDIRGWAARYAELKRDKEEEARSHALWPDAVRLFRLWQRLCHHPRAGWDVERFEQVLPFLKKHGIAMCERAIVGAAFDAFETTRRNGSKKRHDGWELIHRSADKWEEFANRAPLDFVSELEETPAPREDPDVAAAKDAAGGNGQIPSDGQPPHKPPHPASGRQA